MKNILKSLIHSAEYLYIVLPLLRSDDFDNGDRVLFELISKQFHQDNTVSLDALAVDLDTIKCEDFKHDAAVETLEELFTDYEPDFTLEKRLAHAETCIRKEREGKAIIALAEANSFGDDLQPLIERLQAAQTFTIGNNDPLKLNWNDEFTLADYPEDLIEDICFPGEVSVIFAPYQNHKTTMLVDLACSLANQNPQHTWHGKRILTPGPVLFLAYEDLDNIKLRIATWKKFYKAPKCPVAVHPGEINFAKPDSKHKLRQSIKAAVETVGKISAVFIDTAHPALCKAGWDDIDNADVGAFLTILKELAVELRIHIFVAHHTGWDETRPRGAHSWMDDPHNVFQTKFDEEKDIVFFIAHKQKNRPLMKKMPFIPFYEEFGKDKNGASRGAMLLRYDPEAGKEDEATEIEKILKEDYKDEDGWISYDAIFDLVKKRNPDVKSERTLKEKHIALLIKNWEKQKKVVVQRGGRGNAPQKIQFKSIMDKLAADGVLFSNTGNVH
jgi:hypothetical protein